MYALKLPLSSFRFRRQSSNNGFSRESDDTLYPVEIVSAAATGGTDPENEGDVRIHYIGYSSAYDEWRPRDDIVNFVSPSVSEKFCLHNELALRVKSSLVSQRRSNPAVKIEMSFDRDIYEEGLSAVGYVKCTMRGVKHSSIRSYSDLDGLLGRDWHYRGLNSAGDFCYVIEGSIDFYLYKRRPLVQFIPDKDGIPAKVSVPRGYALVFKFIRGDGTVSQFGRLHSVFK